jgi:hypothetical protein
MIDIVYNENHIQKEKESYELADDRLILGGSNTAFKNVDGETYIQDKKIRTDGYVDRYAIRMLCSYAERNTLRKMLTGKGKMKRCNLATLTISDEGDRNTMVKVVGGDSDFYSEVNIIEGIDVIKNHPSEYGYNEHDILYEIDILLIKAK